MNSAAQFPDSLTRRHVDPPVLWQAVLIGSLLLHLLVLFTVRRLRIDVAIKTVAERPIPVEVIDFAPAENPQSVSTANLTVGKAPIAPSRSQVASTAQPLSPQQPVAAIVPSPSPIPVPLIPSPKPSQPAVFQSPLPKRSVNSTPPSPQATAQPSPSGELPTVPVAPAASPVASREESSEPGKSSAPPLEPPSGNSSPITSGATIPATQTSITVGVSNSQLTSSSQRELAGKATLVATVPPLEIAYLGGLQPGTGQQLVAQVQFAIDHATNQVILETIQVLPDSLALREGKITADNLDSLVKKSLQSARFQVELDSSAVNKASATEWEAIMEINVL